MRSVACIALLLAWYHVVKAQTSNNFSEPEMVTVQGGSFNMGSNDGDSDERPIHKVTLSAFVICKYDVTVGEFRKFIEATGYKTSSDIYGGSYLWWDDKDWKLVPGINWEYDAYGIRRPQSEDRHPVVHVSWNDAIAYTRWLTGKTGHKYRLPTEAEWEYAARGGNISHGYIYSGSNNINDVAWYEKNCGYADHSVGTKKPNELGIYDMTGNVWQWCSDKYDSLYYSKSPAIDPQGPDALADHVLRGGAWLYDASMCRVTFRNSSQIGGIGRSCTIGFRVVYSINPM